MKWTFPRKGYGRIYVEKLEDIDKVKLIIKDIDEYEFENYFNDDIIAVFEGRIETTYTHKFDSVDLSLLIERCWQQGIKMFCVVGRREHEYYRE